MFNFQACKSPIHPTFLKVKGHHLIDGNGDTVLLRGMGLGGWMLQEGYMFRLGFIGQQYRIRERISELVGEAETERFYQQWIENHTTKADIDSMAAWGFNSIRLPMHYNLYTLAVEDEPISGENTWLDLGFTLTDSLLSWCKAAGVYLILDLHAAPGGQGHDLHISDRNPDKPSFWDSEANQQKTIALWRKLAERYANEPWIGGYDVINEPNWGFDDPEDKLGVREQRNIPLRKFLVDVTSAIREVDTNHIIFIEGNGFGNNYNGIFPKWDDNLVLSFHKYGNPNTQAAIQHFLDLRDEHNIPLWLGESGENSNTWFTEAIALCEQHGIGWAWWQNKKMGINQPLEIIEPVGYRRLLDYWSGKGEKPSNEASMTILNEWLENLKIENNHFRKDVVDAMFRQINDDQALPFSANKITKGDELDAVNYDLGRQRSAYYDTDTASYRFTPGVNTQGNRGFHYRNDGVDIQMDADGPHVYHIEPGEWLQYTIQVDGNELTSLGLSVASINGTGRIYISIDGKVHPASIPVPATGGETDWETIQVEGISLPPGKRVLRIIADQGGFRFKRISF